MRKNFSGIILSAALLAASFCGFSAVAGAEEAEGTRILVDANGREVTLNETIERAVVSNRYNLEIIRAVGAIDQVVSIDKLAYTNEAFWPEFTEEQVYGNGTRDLDYEKIISYNPDVFIVLPGQYKDEIAEKLGEYDIPVFVLKCSSGQTVEEYNAQITLCAELFGKEEGAERVIDFCSSVRTEVENRLADMPEEERVRVYLEYYDLYTTCFGNESGWGQMIYQAGGYNVIDSTMQVEDSDYADAEAVINSNPDVIIKTVYRDGKDSIFQDNYLPPTEEDYAYALDEMKNREGFSLMDAVENDQIVMCSDFCLRGGGNTVGLAFFAKWLHPDRFEDYDTYAVFDQWMTEFQNMEKIDGHVYGN